MILNQNPVLPGQGVLHEHKEVPPKAMSEYFGRRVTPRDWQYIALVVEGMLNKEIATALAVEEGSVKEQLVRIYRKLGFTNRTQLAVWGVRQLEVKA